MTTMYDVYESVLIELKKQESPEILLEDFLRFWHKSKWIFAGREVAKYQQDPNNLTADALQALTTSMLLRREGNVWKADIPSLSSEGDQLWGVSQQKDNVEDIVFKLPHNYYHIMAVTIAYEVVKPFKCYSAGDKVTMGVNRTTAKKHSVFSNNIYASPSYRNPAFYLSDMPDALTAPTVSQHDTLVVQGPADNSGAVVSTQANGAYSVSPGDVKKVWTEPSIEIRVGKLSPNLRIKQVYIDYFRSPRKDVLTFEQLQNQTEDVSDVVEFPDHVCEEIIKILLQLLDVYNGNPAVGQRAQVSVGEGIAQSSPAV